MDGADELDAFRLQTLASRLDVFDEKPDDWSPGEVSVLSVRGAEDLRLAAVRQPEDRKLAIFMI